MNRSLWCLTLLLPLSYASAEARKTFDWPQWQGPDRNAISTEQGLLKEWTKEGPPLAWRVGKLGGGDSAPSIADGRIFGMSYRGADEVVWALSEADGKSLWQTPIAASFAQGMPQSKEGPGGTPTVDGEKLYVIGMGGDIACLDVKDGKVIWKRSMTSEFGGRVPKWSYRESPLIDGDKVICTPGGEEAALVALDKLTGKTTWKSAIPGNPGAAYSSAIAIEFNGQRQYVQLTAKTLAGVAAADGKFLWKYDQPASNTGISCTTPIYHDGFVFASSAYGNGGGLAQLKSEADGSITAEQVYFTKRMQNHHGGLILKDGYLYGANGGNGGGYLLCLEFQTGKILWDEREGAAQRAPKGSVAMADGRIYYRTEDGTVLLIEPSSSEYIEHGRFEQPDRSKSPAWAHPVIANGKLYIRDQDLLFCYDLKSKP